MWNYLSSSSMGVFREIMAHTTSIHSSIHPSIHPYIHTYMQDFLHLWNKLSHSQKNLPICTKAAPQRELHIQHSAYAYYIATNYPLAHSQGAVQLGQCCITLGQAWAIESKFWKSTCWHAAICPATMATQLLKLHTQIIASMQGNSSRVWAVDLAVHAWWLLETWLAAGLVM